MRPMIVSENVEGMAAGSGFAGQTNDGSDRSLVLCSATRLEQKLGEILEEFLQGGPATERLLMGPSAPLSSLSARLLACHALALIDSKELADGDLTSRICDEFHKSAYTSFGSERVAAMCRKFHFQDRHSNGFGSTAQDNFASAVALLLKRLANRGFYVGGDKREPRTWAM